MNTSRNGPAARHPPRVARRRLGLGFAAAGLAGALALGLLLADAEDGGHDVPIAAGGVERPARNIAGAGVSVTPPPELAFSAPIAPPAPVRLESPASAPPETPVSDDLEQELRPLAEGSEAAHYRRFLELGRRGDGSLSAEAGRAFGRDPAPAGERVALLRALWDSGARDAERWFGSALSAPESTLPEAKVPDFAVTFLTERAARDPAARRILAGHVAVPPVGCDAARLARAAAALGEPEPVDADARERLNP